MTEALPDGSGVIRRSTNSATLAFASAGGFLMLCALLSFVPDAPELGAPWHLRGSIAAISPQTPTPTTLASDQATNSKS